MMRPIVPNDTPGLLSVCEQAGVFSMDEMPELQKPFDDYHEKNIHAGHLAFTEDDCGLLVGVVYLAPKQFTDRTWEILMIMIVGSRQGQGLGTRMLLEAEEHLRKVASKEHSVFGKCITDNEAMIRQAEHKSNGCCLSFCRHRRSPRGGKLLMTKVVGPRFTPAMKVDNDRAISLISPASLPQGRYERHLRKFVKHEFPIDSSHFANYYCSCADTDLREWSRTNEDHF